MTDTIKDLENIMSTHSEKHEKGLKGQARLWDKCHQGR